MNEATIILEVNGSRSVFALENIDLGVNRRELALDLGARIVDTLWEALEGEGN